MIPVRFKGSAVALSSIDVTMVGRCIGVGQDEVHAVLAVETAGGGFDRQGADGGCLI